MRTIATVCIAILVLCAAVAAGPVLVINQDGSYQVMVDGPGGKSVLHDVTQVVDKRGGTPPPPDNPPDTSDPIATQVKAWSKEVGDPTTAQALTIVYREVGKVAAGQSRDKVMAALRQATDSALNATGGTEKWKGWRAKVSALIDSEEAKGPVDYAKFCNSVANGLEASAPAAALDPALLTLIINAILQIIQLIFGLGGGTGV